MYYNKLYFRRNQIKIKYYYRKKPTVELYPKIEFDKDLDYLVQTRDLVVSMNEYVLRDE